MFFFFFFFSALVCHSGRGTDFFLAFPEHPSDPFESTDLDLYVVIFNPTSSVVAVDVTYPKMTSLTSDSSILVPGGSVRHKLNAALQLMVKHIVTTMVVVYLSIFFI